MEALQLACQDDQCGFFDTGIAEHGEPGTCRDVWCRCEVTAISCEPRGHDDDSVPVMPAGFLAVFKEICVASQMVDPPIKLAAYGFVKQSINNEQPLVQSNHLGGC